MRTDGRSDRYDEANRHLPQFCKRVEKKNLAFGVAEFFGNEFSLTL